MNTKAINAAMKVISRAQTDTPFMARLPLNDLLSELGIDSMTVEPADEINTAKAVEAMACCIAFLARGNKWRAVKEIESAVCYLQLMVVMPLR